MKKISVEDIENGMILATEICGQSGNTLLNKGTKLTQNLGRRLKNWGIDFIHIEGEEEVKEQQPTIDTSKEEEKQHLEAKFVDVIKNPIMRELFEAVTSFRKN